MLTLEVFLSCACVSTPAAKSVAEKAVQTVGHIRLLLLDEITGADRAKLIGVAAYPAFVFNDEILAIGTPSLEKLIDILNKRIAETH